MYLSGNCDNINKILKIPKNIKYEQKGIKEKWIKLLDQPEPRIKYKKLKFNHDLKDKYLKITYHLTYIFPFILYL